MEKVSKVEDVLRHDSVCRCHFVPFSASKWRNFIKFSAAAKFPLVGNIRLATAVNLFKTEVWAEVACTCPRKSLKHHDQLSSPNFAR